MEKIVLTVLVVGIAMWAFQPVNDAVYSLAEGIANTITGPKLGVDHDDFDAKFITVD